MENMTFKEYKRQYYEQKAARQAALKKRLVSLLIPIASSLLSIGVVTTSLIIGLAGYYDEMRRLTIGYQIASSDYVLNEDGSYTVTITFVNDALDPVVITIDKGALGENGNEISSVETTVDEDNNIIFTFHFTDEEVEDTVMSFPLRYGNAGRSITYLEVLTDETTGGISFIFYFSDDTESEVFSLPNGFTSEYGVTISAYSTGYDETTGDYTVTISYTNETREDTTFVIVKGEKGDDGVTVSSITRTVSDGYYIITIKMSDNTEYSFSYEFSEVATVWYYGNGDPNSNSYSSRGKDGDFYFDIQSDIVYSKETDASSGALYWKKIFSVHGEIVHPDYCTVTYDTEGGSWEYSSSAGETVIERVKYGEYASVYFSNLGNPYLEGYEFIGWYSVPYDSTDPNPPNVGKLDSLTKIVNDLTVYAWYQ